MSLRFLAVVVGWLLLAAALLFSGIYLSSMLGNILVGFGLLAIGLFFWVLLRSARVLFTGS